MQTLSTTLSNALAAGKPQRILLEFVSGTRQFSNEDITAEGVKLRETYITETDYKIGQCPSAEIRFSLFNEQGQVDDFAFGRFTAYLGARIDSGTPSGKTVVFNEGGTNRTYEFVPLGTFIADRPDVTHGQAIVSITANDLMTLFDRDMPTNITYPKTLKNLLTSLCSTVNVTNNTGNFTNYNISLAEEPDDFENATMREVVGWIAACAGANAVFNRSGQLVFRYFSTQNKTFTADYYNSLAIRNLTAVKPTGIAIHSPDADEDTTYGGQTNPYVISNNPILSGTLSSTVLSNIANCVNNTPTSYNPLSVKLFVDDWCIEAGDVIQIAYGNANHALPVYTQELTWNAGGMTDEVQSGGSAKREPESKAARQKYMNDHGLYKVVTRVEDAEGDITELQQTATSISAKVDGMQVGGRNIILNSDKRVPTWYASATGTITPNQTVSEWGCTDAYRVQGNPGTSALFAIIGGDMANGENTSIAGQNYVTSVYIKNVSVNRMHIRTNPEGTPAYFTIEPNETKRAVINSTGNGSYYLQIQFIAKDYNSSFDFYFWHPQIEHGTFATDWTPALGEGSAREVHNSMAELTSTEFSVTFDGKKALSVKQDEIRADVDVLTATGHIDGDVLNVLMEETYIIVGEGESIQDAVSGLPRYLEKSVYIQIEGIHNEQVVFEGFIGNGVLGITFDNMATLTGNLQFRSCKCPISILGDIELAAFVTIVGLDSTAGLIFENCSNVYINNMSVRGANINHGKGIEADNNSFVLVENTQIDRCDMAVIAYGGSRVVLHNIIGGSDSDQILAVKNTMYCVGRFGCTFGLEGTKPKAQMTEYTDNTCSVLGTATASDSTLIQEAGVTEYVFNSFTGYTALFTSGGSIYRNWASGKPTQGVSVINTTFDPANAVTVYHRGIFYSSTSSAISTALSGKTIRSMTVTLKRDLTQGSTDPNAKAMLYTHGLTTVPSGTSNPTLTSTGLNRKGTNGYHVYTLTSSIIANIQNGTIRGFALKTDDNHSDFLQFTECELRATY